MSTPSGRKVTWLHLSDFHFTEKTEWQQDVVLTSLRKLLTETFKEEQILPDVAFLTGDVAFSGQAGQYRQAKSWLEPLAKELNLPPTKRWFVIPGNYDGYDSPKG